MQRVLLWKEQKEELLHLKEKLSPLALAINPGDFSSLGFSDIQKRLATYGVKLGINASNSYSVMNDLMHGRNVSLISYDSAGAVDLGMAGFTLPIIDYNFFGFASINVRAFFNASLKLTYDVHMGVNARGPC